MMQVIIIIKIITSEIMIIYFIVVTVILVVSVITIIIINLSFSLHRYGMTDEWRPQDKVWAEGEKKLQK